jgi:hypothetical protein
MPRLLAPSISSTSSDTPEAISTHEVQVPHGSRSPSVAAAAFLPLAGAADAVARFWQLSALARMRALAGLAHPARAREQERLRHATRRQRGREHLRDVVPAPRGPRRPAAGT